ncbi:MAG: 3-phosphoshikimate 1-carboxyvinyltransferase [Bacteroides sp.]
MITANTYQVKKLHYRGPFTVKVPGSKSITNRALMLAAMSEKKCVLEGVLFSDDSRAFLDCLMKLGFDIEADEENERVIIQGTGGRIPNPNAAVNVRSAGTAARFLTVMLALAGGDYEMNSSTQMMKRPMEPLLSILHDGGVEFEFMGEEGHFPFKMHSHSLSLKNVSVDTTISSQFTSALLMAGVMLPGGLDIEVTGSRTEGSYIKMTLSMMEQFGINVERGSNCYRVPHVMSFGVDRYEIEPDISAASYFYSLAPLLGSDVCVKRVHRPSLQGDMKYVETLQQLGCSLRESEEGLWVLGNGVDRYPGLTVDMKDFSDQTMTMAAVAVYADSPTEIHNVGHIRFQESDRMAAIIAELGRMGIKCEEIPEKEGIRIYPGQPAPALIETYDDHRIAMSMALTGLRADGIVINNPGCCKKTFENYFETFDLLYVKPSIKAVLLDIDDTIMDFGECSRRAVRNSLKRAGLVADDTMIERYIVHNRHMWELLEKKTITRQELIDTRWKLFFEKENIDFDGTEFESLYREDLGKQHVLIEGATQLLEYLSSKYDLYMATNGVTATQKSRIDAAGIMKYFKDCFISEEIGDDKPSKAFFDRCMERMGQPPKENVMVIGDSLTSDMKGGFQYGLVTCWFNRNKCLNNLGIHCDYVVESFDDIMEII